MRGISHKDLLEIDPWQYDNQQDLLNHILEQCQELNPWLPLEEFLRCGFVGKCWVFWGGFVVETEYDTNGFWYVYRYLDQNTITDVQPIHKPEPPR